MLSNRTTIVKRNYKVKLFQVMQKYETSAQNLGLFYQCQLALEGTAVIPYIFAIFHEHSTVDNCRSYSPFASEVMDALFSVASFKPVFENVHPSLAIKAKRYIGLIALKYTELVRKDVMQIIMLQNDMEIAANIFRIFYEKTRNANIDMLFLILKNFTLDKALLEAIEIGSHFLLNIWEHFQDIITEDHIPGILAVAKMHVPNLLLLQLQKIPKHLCITPVLENICKLLPNCEYAKFSGLINNSVYTELVNAFYPLLPIFRTVDKLQMQVDNESPFCFGVVLIILRHFPTPMPYVIREIVINRLQQHINAITLQYRESYRNAARKFLPPQAPASRLFQPRVIVPAEPVLELPPVEAEPAEVASKLVEVKQKRLRKPRPMPVYQAPEPIALSNRFALLK